MENNATLKRAVGKCSFSMQLWLWMLYEASLRETKMGELNNKHFYWMDKRRLFQLGFTAFQMNIYMKVIIHINQLCKEQTSGVHWF